MTATVLSFLIAIPIVAITAYLVMAWDEHDILWPLWDRRQRADRLGSIYRMAQRAEQESARLFSQAHQRMTEAASDYKWSGGLR